MSFPAQVPPIGEARERELLKNAATYVYRQTEQGPVHAHFFLPADYSPPRQHPVIVFFSGGFWDSPMRTQFVPHCNHFASRGAIAIAAETRVFNPHRTGPLEAIDDAQLLLLWLKVHAENFALNPERIAAGGAAGGALLALDAAMLPEVRNDGIRDGRPRALVLFSPLVDVLANDQCTDRFPDSKVAKRHSPIEHIRKELPPMILFQGKADRILPCARADKFARKMRRKHNLCEFVDFETADHSFFNFNVSEDNFELTIAAADRFLTDLGWLPPQRQEELP